MADVFSLLGIDVAARRDRWTDHRALLVRRSASLMGRRCCCAAGRRRQGGVPGRRTSCRPAECQRLDSAGDGDGRGPYPRSRGAVTVRDGMATNTMRNHGPLLRPGAHYARHGRPPETTAGDDHASCLREVFSVIRAQTVCVLTCCRCFRQESVLRAGLVSVGHRMRRSRLGGQ